MGWHLNLEPQISREINGKDDLDNGYLANTRVGVFGSGSTANNELLYLDQLAKGDIDEQPDQFNYKLASSSGSFMFQKYGNNQYEILAIPFKPLKISYNTNGLQKTFDIRDIDGTKYFFNVREQSSPNLINEYSTNWKCSQIVSSTTKDTISFKYNALRNANNFRYSESVALVDDNHYAYENTPRPSIYNYSNGSSSQLGQLYQAGPGSGGTGSGVFTAFQQFDPIIGFVGWGFESEGGIGINNTEIRGNSKSATVKEIKFRGGLVKLFSVGITDGGSRLDSIKVYDNNLAVVKTIRLFLSYFETPNPNEYPAPDYRLRLDSVVFSDQNKKINSYNFKYYYPEKVYPWTNISDAWGYYQNGGYHKYTGTSVPFFPNVNVVDNYQVWGAGSALTSIYAQNIGGLSKEAYEEPTKYYVLNKIKYPTGGRTEYSYSINKYKENGILKNAGGLRIESIKSYLDEISTNTVLEKIYKYGENEDGDGELKVKPEVSSYMYEQAVELKSSLSNIRGTERKRTFVNTSMEDLYFSNGCPVNYTTVTEYQKDQGVFTGKTIYTFSKYNMVGGVPALTNSTHWPGTDITIKKIDVSGGQLLTTSHYAYNNGLYTWVNQIVNQYQKFEKPNKIHIGKIFRRKIYIPAIYGTINYQNFSDYIYVEYPQEVGAMLLSSQEEKTRNLSDLNGIVTTTKNYAYNNYCFLANQTSNDSRGNTSKVTY